MGLIVDEHETFMQMGDEECGDLTGTVLTAAKVSLPASSRDPNLPHASPHNEPTPTNKSQQSHVVQAPYLKNLLAKSRLVTKNVRTRV